MPHLREREEVGPPLLSRRQANRTTMRVCRRARNLVVEELERRSLLSLLPPVRYPTAGDPVSVLVGDVNGDRVPDLIVVNGFPSYSVDVLPGRGLGGTFYGQRLSFPVDDVTAGVLGDFNGDGKLDLALTTQPPYPAFATVRIYLGNGDGTFHFVSDYAVGTQPFSDPFSVSVGDLRHNGRSDLIVANAQDNTVSVLLGNGDGTFQEAVNYDVGRWGPRSVAVGDFNGDGYPDLAVAIPFQSIFDHGGVMVLLNNGDGTFRNSGLYYVVGDALSVAAADFRGIGRLDLIVSTNPAGVQELRSNGDGTFDITWCYSGVGFLAVADFNGDGIPDFVVTDPYLDTVTVALGNGDGTFLPLRFPAGLIPTSVAVGNLLDNSSFPDVVVGNHAGGQYSVSVLLNDADWQGPFGPDHPPFPRTIGHSEGEPSTPVVQPIILCTDSRLDDDRRIVAQAYSAWVRARASRPGQTESWFAAPAALLGSTGGAERN